MKIVRGRREARWLPSRYRFALFRLWAFARLRRAAPEPRPGVMLVADPDQSAIECYGVSTWVWLTTSVYVGYELAKVWPVPLAILAALPLGSVAIQVPVCTVGALVLPRIHVSRGPLGLAAINSVVLVVLEVLAASHYALERTWIRFVAWQFLAVVGLNAVAATIVFLLRGSIARLESTYECAP